MDTTLYFSSWSQALFASLQNIWFRLTNYLPQIIGALIVLLVGIFIAKLLERVVIKIISVTRINTLMRRTGIQDDAVHIGFTGTIADWVGSFIKWFVIAATLLAVSNVLQIDQLSQFLEQVLLYIPRVIIAIIILAVGLVGGRLVYQMTERGIATAGIDTVAANLFATISKWAIIIFAIMAALIQLGIAATLIHILFGGIVAMLALAGGIALGLGGKDKAHEVLDKIGNGLKSS